VRNQLRYHQLHSSWIVAGTAGPDRRLGAMATVKHMKKGRIQERAHQYEVIADRLQFHLNAETLPQNVAEYVRTAKEALASAAAALRSEPFPENGTQPSVPGAPEKEAAG
jgi:hypothetical protein